MQVVRSLPPELQRLIDEYNSLLKSAGYVNPYVHSEFNDTFGYDGNPGVPFVAYSAPDANYNDPVSLNKSGFDPTKYRRSDLSYPDWENRDRMILNKYRELMALGMKLIEEGKIEAVPNPRIGKPDTYIYDIVQTPEDGRFIYITTSKPEAPMFREISRPSPMKPLKSGRQELPARELRESVSMNIPQAQKELIMRSNPRMRTGQEPNYYLIKDGNRKRVRPVEEEELQYYRTQNRI
tara:strand:- start:699 stop:1409 length:711 start_codon:yes stop_codon:yes gene_type:complete